MGRPSWLSAFLDFAPADFERGVEFWQDVTGYRLSEPRGEHHEFATLVPPQGDDFLRVQRLGEGPSRIHLDVHVDDPRAEAERAVGLGAEEVADLGYVVLRSPGGLTFCLVDRQRATRPPAVDWADGGRSLVDQVCLDIPPGRFAAEADFWSALTGWERRASRHFAEFEYLERPAGVPLRLLLQRLGDDTDRDVGAHLDLACDDRERECRRHVRLGARVTAEHARWTVLADPAGAPYCLTDRGPDSGLLGGLPV